MGTVLRAYHLQLERAVAIKIMHGDLVNDADSARRFAAEARAAACIESDHAVRILDIDRLESHVAGHPGHPFIVMELLEGEDLSAVLAREGRLAPARAVDYLLQALEAVAEAHERGIVHRDLKPQNLFLTKRGVVKVVDFGLAKTLALASTNAAPPGVASGTQTNVMMGSPHYMSPEQVRSARRVDARSDVWSIGATLYHLLSGLPPFAAPNVFLLCARILNEPAPSLLRRLPDLPPAYDIVVQRCMKKDPKDRYSSVEELRAALCDALDATTMAPDRHISPSRPPSTARTVDDTAPMATLQFSKSDLDRRVEVADLTERIERPRR
jgi:serine/threonine-protein kinase